MPFSQLSPSIVAYDNASTTLYIKSDQVFTPEELVYYHDRGKGNHLYNSIPNGCKASNTLTSSHNVLPGCQFFDIQYNEVLFAQGDAQPYSGSTPLIFETSGYNPQTFLGYLTFICKYCDKGDTVSVRVGHANNTKECIVDKLDRKPEILKNKINGEETEYTRLACRVPPYEGVNIPVVVSRGLSKTLPFFISYRPPTILKVATTNNSIDCYSTTFQSNEQVCESINGCVWDTKIAMCVLAVETAGCIIDIMGLNFGTRDLLAYMGGEVGDSSSGTNIQVVEHTQTLIRARIPPLQNNTAGIVWVRVAGQSSKTTSGNPHSKMFTIKYGEPKISRVILPKNARTAGGSILYIKGENFGRKELKDVSVIVGKVNFPVLKHNHTYMIAETQPGQGKSLPIQVRVVDAISKPAQIMFAYSKPLVYTLYVDGQMANASNPQNVPTTGKHKNGSAVVLTIVGDNFGIPGSATVWFGIEGAFLKPTRPYVEETHSSLSLLLPPGSGIGHSVNIEVALQIISSNVVKLSYSPPQIQSMFFPDGKMTSGCAKYGKEILPGRNGLRCEERGTFTLRGINFGRSAYAKIEMAAGIVYTPKILYSSHTEIQMVLPRGM